MLAQLGAQQSGATWLEGLALLDPVLGKRGVVDQRVLAELGDNGFFGGLFYAGAAQAAADLLFAAWPLRQKAQSHVDGHEVRGPSVTPHPDPLPARGEGVRPTALKVRPPELASVVIANSAPKPF